jgi:hypothetical protein
MKKIKLFGERNTGTNYLRSLIELNLQVELIKDHIPRIKYVRKLELFHSIYFFLSQRSNLGWKHANINVKFITRKLKENNALNIVLIVKNPYSFLLSLHKRPYHNKGKTKISFNDFIKSNWKTRKREYLNKQLDNPIDLWNIKTKNYLNLQKKHPTRVLLLKYEDLVANPQEIIGQIAIKFDLKTKLNEFSNFSKSTKNEKKSFSDYSAYYVNEKWREKLSESDIYFINSKLNKNICSELNYNILKL